MNSSENKLGKIKYMYVRMLLVKGKNEIYSNKNTLENILDRCGLYKYICDHESYHYNTS